MVATVLKTLTLGLQPTAVWQVKIEPTGFYEIYWDDFAIQGESGWYLLHFGMSD